MGAEGAEGAGRREGGGGGGAGRRGGGGGGFGQLPLSLSTPSSMASAGEEEQGTSRGFLCSFLCPLLGSFLAATISFVSFHIFLGQAWAEGKGELATCRHRVDSRREEWITGAPP